MPVERSGNVGGSRRRRPHPTTVAERAGAESRWPSGQTATGLAALLAVACGGGSGPSGSTSPVASVTVVPAAVNIAVGDSVQLRAITKDASGTVVFGRAVTWTSNAPGVATVPTTASPTAFVTAVASGNAVVTATSEGQSGSASTLVGLVFTDVSTGSAHTCGITIVGTAYCWGNNSNYELGLGPTTGPDGCGGTSQLYWCSTKPAAVASTLAFQMLSLGSGFSCGLATNEALYCWGLDSLGQLGNGGTSSQQAPAPVVGTTASFTAVSAGTVHACGLTSTKALYCWGANSWGQLGNGMTTTSSVPVAVAGGYSWVAVSVGDYHTCGVTLGGAAFCWGFGFYGELGNGSAGSVSTPSAVASSATFAAVSAGSEYSCGLTTGGAAYCWGRNDFGNLGDSTTLQRFAPVAVVGGLTFTSIGTATNHTCGLVPGGTMHCWGYGFETAPVPAGSGLTFATLSVSIGGLHACGIATTRMTYCWGDNSVGQLGTGTTTSSATPVKVVGQP